MGYSIIRYPFFYARKVRERMVLRLEDLNLKRKKKTKKSLLLKKQTHGIEDVKKSKEKWL